MARRVTAQPADRLTCRRVRRTLRAFLDGEVAPARAELVAAHLESCSRCRIESETLTRVTDDPDEDRDPWS